MVLQPGGQGLSPAVGQQVDDPVTLQVAQDRAVALALAPGPVINTQDTGRRQGLQRRLTDAAQQGRGADRDRHRARHACSSIAAQCQGDGVVQGTKAIGVASSRLSDGRRVFGERPFPADGVDAAEAADAYPQNKLTSQTGNVADAAVVVAVNPC